MNLWPHRGGRAALVPLCCLVFLPLLACAGIVSIGEQSVPSALSPSELTGNGWDVCPGLGATILPRWTLGNYDPRLEGPARGEEWPVPAGIPCAPDRSTTLTRFPRCSPGEPLPRLERVAGGEVR